MTQRNTQGVVLALALGLASAGCGAAPEGADAGAAPTFHTEATATATDTSTIPADAIYVSPTGTSSGNGTAASPYDLATAVKKVAAGKYIAVKGGTYKLSSMVRITTALSGSAGAMKYLVNVPGERVILDFSAQATSSSNYGLRLDGSYWYVKGLEIQGAGDNGMYLTGSNNVVEGCTFRGNRDAGFQLSTSSSTARASWPSYNLVLNCESYDNHDATGENADGFAAKLAVGPGNVFRGCVSHHNSDDGWDLFTKTSYGVIDPIVIDRCVAFANGSLTDGTTFSAGDRNGFKLGGSDMAVAHVVTRSIAFGNGKNGFTWNSNPGVIWLVNNTAWDNSVGNFKFDNTSAAVFVNNVSFWTSGSGQNDRAGANSGTVVANNAFWDTSKKTLWGFAAGAGSVVKSADFQSVAAPTSFPLPRLADGSFDLGGLGRLASASVLVDVGVVPSTPSGAGAALPFDPATYYLGAPDAGAVELR